MGGNVQVELPLIVQPPSILILRNQSDLSLVKMEKKYRLEIFNPVTNKPQMLYVTASELKQAETVASQLYNNKVNFEKVLGDVQGGEFNEGVTVVLIAWMWMMFLHNGGVECFINHGNRVFIWPNQNKYNCDYNPTLSRSSDYSESTCGNNGDSTMTRHGSVQANQFINEDNVNLEATYNELQRRTKGLDFECTQERFKQMCSRPYHPDYRSNPNQIEMICDKEGLREAISALEMEAKKEIDSIRRPTVEEYKKCRSDFIFTRPTTEGYTHFELKNSVSSESLEKQGYNSNLYQHGRNMSKKCLWQQTQWERKNYKTLCAIDFKDTDAPERIQVLKGVLSGAKVDNIVQLKNAGILITNLKNNN